MSGSHKGVQNSKIKKSEIKIKHFYQYEYQQLSLLVLLVILPRFFPMHYCHFSFKKQEHPTFFHLQLAKPLSKVHVSSSWSNTDYDPKDIHKLANVSSVNECHKIDTSSRTRKTEHEIKKMSQPLQDGNNCEIAWHPEHYLRD